MAPATVVAALFLSTVTAKQVLPNGHAWGCLPGNISSSLPFCDTNLSISDRVADLVGRLTLDEKVRISLQN
jgi:hypothetical protein